MLDENTQRDFGVKHITHADTPLKMKFYNF